MVKTDVSKKGIGAWAKGPVVPDPAAPPKIYLNALNILEGLREEYTPDLLPVSSMYKDGVIHLPYLMVDGKFRCTIRGWFATIRNRRAHGSHCDAALWRLEETFLELYPPFGEFTPPLQVPWRPGMVKSGPRLPTVEYSLTTVFDSKILPRRGGWEAFHRLISRAMVKRSKNTGSLRSLWKKPEEVEKEVPITYGGYAINPPTIYFTNAEGT